MNEVLKQNIIDNMQSLHERIGETVYVEDWISTGGRNYDRHQTTYGRQILKIQDFRIRFSGSIATIRDDIQQIEFRTDSIQYIEQKDEQLIIEMNMKDDVWRRIKISKINPTDNKGSDGVP